MSDNQIEEFRVALSRIRLERQQQARRQAVQCFHRLLDRSPDYNKSERAAMRAILDELDLTSPN